MQAATRWFLEAREVVPEEGAMPPWESLGPARAQKAMAASKRQVLGERVVLPGLLGSWAWELEEHVPAKGACGLAAMSEVWATMSVAFRVLAPPGAPGAWQASKDLQLVGLDSSPSADRRSRHP
jgi:hypothetical protein